MNLRCAAALCALLAAAGCGQKGPLYLPGDPSEGRIVLPTEELPAGSEEGPAETENGAGEGPQEPQNPDDQNPTDQNPIDQNPIDQNPIDDGQ